MRVLGVQPTVRDQLVGRRGAEAGSAAGHDVGIFGARRGLIAELLQFGGDTPLGRAGQPSECAGAFVFLASPADASYVSGSIIGVTGGKAVF